MNGEIKEMLETISRRLDSVESRLADVDQSCVFLENAANDIMQAVKPPSLFANIERW